MHVGKIVHIIATLIIIYLGYPWIELLMHFIQYWTTQDRKRYLNTNDIK